MIAREHFTTAKAILQGKATNIGFRKTGGAISAFVVPQALSIYSPYAVSAPKNLTFSAVRQLMFPRGDAIIAASANTEARRETVDSLKTLWGPAVSAQGGELCCEVHIDIDRSINTPLGAMPVKIEENKDFNGPRAAITATMPIFTGGKILAEQRAGKHALEEADARATATSVEEGLKLIGHYFGPQLARALEKARKETLDQQEKELARAKKFEAEGMISDVERMGAQVGRDKSEREWLAARDNSRVARIQLARLPRADDFGKLETPLFVLKKIPGSAKDWEDATFASNPHIAVKDAQVKLAEQGVASARGNFFPDVFAFGSHSFIQPYHYSCKFKIANSKGQILAENG